MALQPDLSKLHSSSAWYDKSIISAKTKKKVFYGWAIFDSILFWKCIGQKNIIQQLIADIICPNFSVFWNSYSFFYQIYKKIIINSNIHNFVSIWVSDAGLYECQTSTTPVMSHHVFLKVAGTIDISPHLLPLNIWPQFLFQRLLLKSSAAQMVT